MNMPILYQNCIGMYSSETAKKAWLWFADTRGSGMQYAADRYADEVELLVLSLRPMLDMASSVHTSDGECIDDLMRFILKRHANYRLGGNIKMWWE